MFMRLGALATALFTSLTGFAAAQAIDAQAAWETAFKARVEGPADVPLGNQAIYHMGADLMFIPAGPGTNLMKAWGNSVGEGFMGLVTAKSDQEQWVITIDHVAQGYVKDDEAAEWNKDELLQSLKDGTAAQNSERLKMGMGTLTITGWVEEPAYDKATHRLIWSLAATDSASPAGAPQTVNYNTYALGREGYFEINLLTTVATVAHDKEAAKAVLAGVAYNPGRAYVDFVEGTDSVAGYGIAALVGGGLVAKKFGLIAVIGLLFAKFAKLFLIGGAVIAAGFYKLLGRRKDGGV